MQLLISDVLDAYRADLSNAGRSRFSENDPTWLAFGTQLQRAISLPNAERMTYLRAGASRLADDATQSSLTSAIAALARDPEFNVALCAAVMFVAQEAEDAGAFALATLILDSARALVGLGEVRLQGRLLGRQARILRKIGEADSALELFVEIAEMGAAHGDHELIARAHLGKGVLARMRGNNPQARAEFLATLESPRISEELQDIHCFAHHGLLVVSAIAKDFDMALEHGSRALDAARTDGQRTELLVNLASVCYDVGWFRSSLHGYLRVLAEGRRRHRISAFGGAAVAAARLHEAGAVHTLAKAAASLLTNGGLEYELADMTREFAEAYSYLGDTERYAQYQRDAIERARRGGFFEILHRLETFSPPSSAARPQEIALTGNALAVARELASGDSDELLVAAVSENQQWRPSGRA